jgi:hypothetical protein
MRTHVTVLAWLHIALGSLTLLGGLLVFLIFGGLAGTAALSGGHDAAPAGAVFGVVGTMLLFFISLFAIPQLLLGWGLLQGASWARILGIVMSILSLIHPGIIVFTALGVYGLVVLFNEETVRMFEGPRLRSY